MAKLKCARVFVWHYEVEAEDTQAAKDAAANADFNLTRNQAISALLNAAELNSPVIEMFGPNHEGWVS